MKNLLINSHYDLKLLLPLLENLMIKDHTICSLTHDKNFAKLISEKGIRFHKIIQLRVPNFFKSFIFLLSYPFCLALSFFFVSFLKFFKKISHITLFNWPEILLLSPWTKLFKIKTIWFILPEFQVLNLKPCLKILIKLNSKNIIVIAINNQTKNNLHKIISAKNTIHLLSLGIRQNCKERQDNIFSQISKTEHELTQKKHFSIGTVTNLDKNQNLETLFHAITKCQSVIPAIQLVIVGDGPERKNLTWIAKKMNIGDLTWFVGEQKHLNKWLTDFNIYVSVSKKQNLHDIYNLENAMAAHLPIIGIDKTGAEELLSQHEGIILEKEDSELMADEIIKLYKHKLLMHKLGEAAQKKSQTAYNIDKMSDLFENLVINPEI